MKNFRRAFRNLTNSVSTAWQKWGAADPVRCYRLTGRVPFPDTIHVDPINACQLHCPLCPTGSKKLPYPPVILRYKTFQKIFKEISSARAIGFFNWGEPFLNPEIFEMIRLVSQSGKISSAHSNFSFKRDDRFFYDLVRSGLTILVLSIDGASPATYEKYRIGGNLDLVYENIRRLVKAKKDLNSPTPYTHWKFLINRHNEHEIAEARQMATELGILFLTEPMGLGEDLPSWSLAAPIEELKNEWLPRNPEHRHPWHRQPHRTPIWETICPYLFRSPVINPDGNIFPCCFVTDIKDSFGNILQEPFQRIWHNISFTSARALFVQRPFATAHHQTICHRCTNYQKKRISRLES